VRPQGSHTQFETEFEKLKDKPFMIIDLRYNSGGNSGNSEKITKNLIREKQKASVSSKTLKPTPNNYKGTLIVLIGTSTFSAAESFALDSMESGNAIFIGSETRGDTGNIPRDFKTKQVHLLKFQQENRRKYHQKDFQWKALA